MSNTLKGGITLLLILYFPVSIMLGIVPQATVIAALVGFTWAITGDLFPSIGRKLFPAQKAEPPKLTSTSPVTEMLQGNAIVEQFVPSGDNRKDTASAIRTLPNDIPLDISRDTRIKILYDGKRWYSMHVGKDGHWGIFGTTGSGKGNAIRLIALSVLELGPDVATLTVLDGKGGLDYSFCDDVDHAQLYYRDTNELTAGAQAILTEMKRRQDLLFAARVENIWEYNKIATHPLPLQVVIADELLSFDNDAKTALGIFAAQSRALGGVLVIATQYPTTDVIPSQIQANVTNRLVGRLASSEYTRVALRRTKSDNSAYEPAMIPQDKPGVMVLRQDSGNEILGRSPKFTRDVAAPFIAEVVSRYPRVNFGALRPAQSATGVSAGATMEQAITTSPLTEQEQIQIAIWVEQLQSQGITQYRRNIARQLYKYRGGSNLGYDGSGPLYQTVMRHLDAIGA